MWAQPDSAQFALELFLAGEYVCAGVYQRVGGGRDVTIEGPDYLPAAYDGTVACYTRVRLTWSETQHNCRPAPGSAADV